MNTDFILVVDDVVSSHDADHMIRKFEDAPGKQEGRTGSGVDKTKKNSTDLFISSHENWQTEHKVIFEAVQRGLLEYARKFPYFLCSGISLGFNENGQVRTLNADDIVKMPDDQLLNILKSVFVIEPINLQKYDKSEGGYFYWHSEQFPHPTDKTQRSLHRQLLWLMYLNDVEEGGATEFFHQDVKITPKQGRLVIAPCGFTHTHRGNAPLSGEKYVLASWIGFRPSSQLYR